MSNWAPVSCITASSAGRSTVSCSLISEARTVSERHMCYCVLEEHHRAGKQAGSMLLISTANNSHYQTRTTKPLLLSLLFKPKGQAQSGHFIHLCFLVAHSQLLCWIPANRQWAFCWAAVAEAKIQRSSWMYQASMGNYTREFLLGQEPLFCQEEERHEVMA